MFATTGVTVVTVFALVCGLLVHGLKQYVQAKRNKAGITFRSYIMENGAETAIAVICSVVLYLGLPELAELMPDIAKYIGVGPKQRIFDSFVCGFIGNSLADLLGKRAQKIAGAAA